LKCPTSGIRWLDANSQLFGPNYQVRGGLADHFSIIGIGRGSARWTDTQMFKIPVSSLALAAAMAATSLSAAQAQVPLTQVGNSYAMAAVAGSVPIVFYLDTGADLVCLPNAIADELVRRGEATLIDSDARSFNADGSFLKTRRLILRKLSVGEHQLTNIMVADGCSDALFGQSALHCSHPTRSTTRTAHWS
jgi:hypothetical protein